MAATGHRPEKLGGYDMKTRRALGALATEYLHEQRPDQVIVGMALGWDQAVAAACIVLAIPFVAAVPFQEHGSNWPKEARDRYFALLEQAAERVTVWEQPYGPTFTVPAAMERRNRWMVDRADKIAALWDGSGSGTGNCVRYAEREGIEVENLWWRWIAPADVRELLG